MERMELNGVLTWILYLLAIIFGLWALGRILVWQVARFMRVWFKIDIVVASVGIFCANGISVRVNDLQSLEIDKVSLKIKPKSRHSLSLHFSDVRIRAERNSSLKKVDKAKEKPHSDTNNGMPKRWKLIQWFARHISLNIDSLNIMILNAFVPESLLHLDVSQVHIAGGGRDVVDSGIAEELAKSTAHQVREEMFDSVQEASALGLLLSVGEIRGKILKSSKGGNTGNTCIVEVKSSFKIGAVASKIKPQLKLEYVGLDLEKLSVELHSGALIPGLLLPQPPHVSNVDDILDRNRTARKPIVPLRQAGPIKAALLLPMLTQCRLKNLDILVFGDLAHAPGIRAESHSSVEKVLHFSISAITLSQRKNPERMVTVSTAGFANAQNLVEAIDLPTGYIRSKIEDFNISTMNRIKLLTMSRVSAETKMTSNCVLSSSLDFTLCYIHYYHKEMLYWTDLFRHKISKMKRERPHVTFATNIITEKPDLECSGSVEMKRKKPTHNSRGEGPRVRELPPQSTYTPTHKRTRSAPNNFYHAEEYYSASGTPQRPELAVPKDLTSLVNVLNTLGISTVCECTFYEAVIDATLPKAKAPGPDNNCVFSFGFDCITMSVDHSANSQDINFMTKLDRICWKPRNTLMKDPTLFPEASSMDSRWIATEATPYHKTDIHDWGTAFSLDTLRLHGQATFGPAIGSAGDKSQKNPPRNGSFWPRQHIAISIDAKVAGTQVELSQMAAQCIACISSCITGMSGRRGSTVKPPVSRQTSLAVGGRSSSGAVAIKKLQKYSFSLAFAEIEVSHVNLFVLPSDMSGSVDCLIVRIDSLRSESDLTDRRLNIESFGIGTVHNPYFSAFATYESGYRSQQGGKPLNLGQSSVPLSVRQQQMKVSQYHCVSANDMQPLHAGFNCLDIEYKVINREEPEDEFPSCIKSLSISLSHDRDITISWSPKLHMLVHHELVEMYHILLRPATATTKNAQTNIEDKIQELPQKIHQSPKKQARVSLYDPPDHELKKTSNVPSAGDGPSVIDTPTENIKRQVSFTTTSRICIKLSLKENMSVEFLFNPIRYTEVDNVSNILFNKAQVMMDGHNIFSFMHVKIKLAATNERVQQDRESFNDLITKSNRVWSFNLAYWSCHFPHGYDFAATFDQFVTTFKWVKGLYRTTSHPFRSPKLPPDLLIVIEKFVFELADWDFECRLRDNHELMKDEWKESEKRRKILDQRVADLRREKGELLPAKKIEELYLKLEEQNTKIYVDRCKKLHLSKCSLAPTWKTHSRASSVPQNLLSPTKLPTIVENVPPCAEKENIPESQVRSSSFSFGTPKEDPDMNLRRNPPLFSWTVRTLAITVLADQSMHGMENAIETLKSIDKVAPFPDMKTEDADGYEFVTLWCRNIKLKAARHQCRIRNYPQYLMDVTEWEIWGKFCGAEQKGSPTAQRTETVPLPLPWGPAKVNRNMPALKFYHDFSSDVQTFNMAWGPCWDPAWSQVNLAINLLNHPSIDPSTPLPWWDKARIIYHGRLMMSMYRSSLLQLASLDPYNTTEHMHWDWKSVLMDWTNGNFDFKGDLDIHIRNASKYDDIRFLHLPGLRMIWDIKWLCKDNMNPDDHHSVEPCAPDKVPGDLHKHDSFEKFRSENLNLSVSLVVDPSKSECDANNKNPEILFYSTTLRWLTNFATAINGVTRPVCKGAIFKNHSPPKLKLSRHYKTNTLSFKFPNLKMRYWSSYAQQLGVEWRCGKGSIETKFKLSLIPFDGPLLRRSRGDWSLVEATCELSQTKVYLIKQGRKRLASHEEESKDSDTVSQHSSSSTSSSSHEQTASSDRGCLEANFLLSLSHMTYRLENDLDGDKKSNRSASTNSSVGSAPPTPSREPRSFSGQFHRDKRQRASQRNRKTPATPRKPPSQHRHHLVVHDLRAMWTTDNRDVAFGLYEGYNKAAILKHNLSTKVLKNILLKPSENAEDTIDGASLSSLGSSKSQKSSVASSEYGPDPVSPSEKLMESANSLLNKLLSDTDKRFVVSSEVPTSDKEQLNGVAACQMDDVANQNWRIKFFNCQAMLKGPKTQGYIILTAAEADLVNREHKVSWRDAQLTSKSTWMGSLNDMQIFATVERNVSSSGKDGENVPWLTVTNIERRGPSPGMLNINDLMTGGQAIGGVVGDGVAAGSFQLQRIMSRCSCRMYYVGYELIVDSEETDYGQLLTTPTPDKVYPRLPEFEAIPEESSDLIGKEKPVNILTVVQPDLEICTNNSQYMMILDIVENLLLYVEPGMREHWERVDRMRFQLQLTSMDDVVRHRDDLTRLQDEIRQRLNHIRQLERDLFKVDRMLDKDSSNEKLTSQSLDLQNTLVNEKETLKEDSEELGIIIRCFKELYLKQKSSSVNEKSEHEKKWDDEDAAVARRTEVSFAQVKWHLTDADGQLTIAKFELRNFLYEKVNKSDDSVEHHFELGWLWMQNLLPNSIYVDVLKPQGDPGGANSYTVVGSGGRKLALRALCKVRPPVGGISVKDRLEFDVVPLIIQLTDQFFKRMMSFFFPGKNSEDEDPDDSEASKDSRNATLLGLSGSATNPQATLKPPKPPSPPKGKGSASSISTSTSGSVKQQDQITPGTLRKNWKHNRGGKPDMVDDVDKMKQRAAKNNTFLYIKIPQFPLRVSYKGQKEKNIEDVRDFNLAIPMLVYHNMTWTWHDLAMAIKRDCKKTLISQVIKEKFHLGSSRGSHKDKEQQQQPLPSSGVSRSSSSLPAAATLEGDIGDHKKDDDKYKMLFGSNLKRSDSYRKSAKKVGSMFKKKK